MLVSVTIFAMISLLTAQTTYYETPEEFFNDSRGDKEAVDFCPLESNVDFLLQENTARGNPFQKYLRAKKEKSS